jgi:4-hydroxy-tetrahydrodipicolinate reductase
MTKVIVAGASGRMGSRIVALMPDYPELKLAGAFERKGLSFIGKDAGIVAGCGEVNIRIADSLEAVIEAGDLIIDFTVAESTLNNIRLAASRKKGMIIGTTGLSAEQIRIINDLSSEVPVVFTPNMSVGVNVLFKILKDISPVLAADFDIEIIEAHHRLKKDAPSGTAIKLAQVIADAVNRNLDEVAVYARKGITGERTKKEIGIQTVRAGDIVGEHTVLFGGLGERIEIVHKASSRDTFARGALRAAVWLSGKKPGLYDMQDVLGLK